MKRLEKYFSSPELIAAAEAYFKCRTIQDAGAVNVRA